MLRGINPIDEIVLVAYVTHSFRGNTNGKFGRETHEYDGFFISINWCWQTMYIHRYSIQFCFTFSQEASKARYPKVEISMKNHYSLEL